MRNTSKNMSNKNFTKKFILKRIENQNRYITLLKSNVNLRTLNTF